MIRRNRCLRKTKNYRLRLSVVNSVETYLRSLVLRRSDIVQESSVPRQRSHKTVITKSTVATPTHINVVQFNIPIGKRRTFSRESF